MITALHNGFFLSDAPFIPLISEGENRSSCNAVRILLPAYLSHDLNWEEARSEAKKAVEEGKLLFWEFQFGLESKPFFLTDPVPFLSFSVAIDQFKESLWKEFETHSIGACLYRGEINPHLTMDEEVSLIDLLASYLHRLASFLPDPLPAFALFDASNIQSQALVAKLLSKERFAHIQLAVKGASIPLPGLTWETGSSPAGWIGKGNPSFPRYDEPAFGVCLPNDDLLTNEALHQMDLLFEFLKGKEIAYRIIPEPLLSEQWDGLDTILYIPSALSPLGKRMLQGFAVSGGTLLEISGFLSQRPAFDAGAVQV